MADKKLGNGKQQSYFLERLIVLGTGVPCMAIILAFFVYGEPLQHILPISVVADSLAERMAFGLKCCAMSSICLIVGIQVVANMRLFSNQINPVGGNKPTKAFEINCRYVSNTSEQLLLHVIGNMVASANRSIDLRYILLNSLLFCVGRLLFWIGYHIKPTGRAIGMVLTMLSSTGLTVYCVYLFVLNELSVLF